MNMLWAGIFALLVQTGATASVDGSVVKFGSGEPLARATVALWNDKNTAAVVRVTTDANGRFTISNIQAGNYRLMASHSGPYMPAEYGQNKPARRGTLITFTAGQKITGIQLALPPTSSISGRILDSDGEPLGRAEVQALQSVYQDGRKVLKPVQSIMTNDLGEYRLHLLPPGRYYIRGRVQNPNEQSGALFVNKPDSPLMFYNEAATPYISHRAVENGEIEEFVDVPVYFPGTIDSEMAMPLEVRIGDNPSGMDFTIASGHLGARRIRGRVLDSVTGRPVRGASVEVVPRIAHSIVFLRTAESADDGSFEITGVVEGSYSLLAAIYPPGSVGDPLRNSGIASGRVSMDVRSEDVDNVTVLIVPNFDIPARIAFEGSSKNDSVTRFSVSLVRDPDIMGYGSAVGSMKTPATDGIATITGVGLGDYRVELSGAGYLKSVRLGSSDVLSDGLHLDRHPEDELEIVVGTDFGFLEGRVINDSRQPVSDAFVVLVPRARLRQRSNPYSFSTTDAVGVFRMNIVPGDYEIFAWTDIEPGAWQDPDIMRSYENQGKPISVGDGTKQNIEVSVIQ